MMHSFSCCTTRPRPAAALALTFVASAAALGSPISYNDQSGATIVFARTDGFNDLVQTNFGLPTNIATTGSSSGSVTSVDDTPGFVDGQQIESTVTANTSWSFTSTATTARLRYTFDHSAISEGNGGTTRSDGQVAIQSTTGPLYVAVAGRFRTNFTSPAGGETRLEAFVDNGALIDETRFAVGEGTTLSILAFSDQPVNVFQLNFLAVMTAYGPGFPEPDSDFSNGFAGGSLTFFLSADPITNFPAAPSAVALAAPMLLGLKRRR